MEEVEPRRELRPKATQGAVAGDPQGRGKVEQRREQLPDEETELS